MRSRPAVWPSTTTRAVAVHLDLARPARRSGRRRRARGCPAASVRRPAASSRNEPPRVSRSPLRRRDDEEAVARRAPDRAGVPSPEACPGAGRCPAPAPARVVPGSACASTRSALKRVRVRVGQVVRGHFLAARVERQRARGVQDALQRHDVLRKFAPRTWRFRMLRTASACAVRARRRDVARSTGYCGGRRVRRRGPAGGSACRSSGSCGGAGRARLSDAAPSPGVSSVRTASCGHARRARDARRR